MNRLGRRLLALAFAGIGIIYLVHAFVPRTLFPGPPWQASTGLLINVAWGLFFLGSAALLGLPKAPHPLCVAVAAVLFAYTACLHVTVLLVKPTDPQALTSVCEVVGLAAGCLAASGLGVRCGRILYGLTLVGLGVQHFRFHVFVDSLVPSWYPMHAIWTYVTAVGFLAGAVSYLAGLQVRLASILLAVMFLVFVFTLHAPDILAHPGSGGRWTGMFVALGFASGALMFAGSRSAKSA